MNISDIRHRGQIGNQILVAYQPSSQTVSITNRQNVTRFLEYLLGSLQITVNESSSPLWPGYCAGDEVPEAVPTQAVSETAQVGQAEQAAQVGSESNKEQVEAELESIKGRFSETFKKDLSF